MLKAQSPSCGLPVDFSMKKTEKSTVPIQLVIFETTDVWKLDAPLRHVKPQVAKVALVSVILWNMVRLACLTQECYFLHFGSAMMFDTVDGRNHVWTKLRE